MVKDLKIACYFQETSSKDDKNNIIGLNVNLFLLFFQKKPSRDLQGICSQTLFSIASFNIC